MITKNFKNLLACMLMASSVENKGMLPCKNTLGRTYYIGGYFYQAGFPSSLNNYVRTDITLPGIFLGTGNSAESEDSYALDNMITSGISCTVTIARGMYNGNPYIEFTISVENTGSSSITIKEIGYAQSIIITDTQSATGQTNQNTTCLFDRTVLSSPVTIAAGATKTIQYILASAVA